MAYSEITCLHVLFFHHLFLIKINRKVKGKKYVNMLQHWIQAIHNFHIFFHHILIAPAHEKTTYFIGEL